MGEVETSRAEGRGQLVLRQKKQEGSAGQEEGQHLQQRLLARVIAILVEVPQ